MAIDAVCLQAVVEELKPQLLGLRVDKVQQPARDQAVLLFRGKRLLLNAGAGAPRLQLTELPRDNPAEPPMFCMLLRKHLSGARVAGITQPPLERLVRLEFDASDELGRAGKRTLVLEAMGRRSNLILLDGEDRVIDSLRRVDADMSAQRQVLPGLFYQPPASAGRLPFLEETEAGFAARFASAPAEKSLDGFLLDQYFGLSPLMARELAFRAAGDVDARLFQLGGPGPLWRALEDFSSRVRENRFTPLCLLRDGKPLDFACVPVGQYGGAAECVAYPSFSALLDAFYAARERQERARQRGADLLRAASTARDRLRRKLALQEKEYAATQDRDQLRVRGDLITASLYRMERGQSRLECENYYEDNAPVSIPLDPLLTPQQNAAKYYKRYAKAKTAEKYLREQMDLAKRDLEYLESVLAEIAQAETEADYLDIRAELREAGFLKKQGKGKKEKSRPAAPWEFRTSSGLRVLVGRNNRQNDKLTLKDADRRDLWFHTQKIHGSHVILRCAGQSPTEEDVAQAALLAAWFSQARESGNVPVDFTEVRNVKKPSGGRPGMVVYNTCRTLRVTPEEAAVERLRVK
ncbi:MAG: fibronectin/fibrinogen-binding protein [Oscillibacter sp.]|jgi:predicted ribosome quality control (RQC) complex YloA/Tae2 family protein|uniref:Rqc2 family fibronectin-binding protein n=1 Tax=uncultured Oscillibacter sp. TaxID=876091 RepID=UPI00216F5453|nr:NFACT RNA binding domain-containing protein [uncultured Oscillibacter sp.]MCI9644575.1 fibronectin/fibrinogen-binding protein [Oscillibacter sp.]